MRRTHYLKRTLEQSSPLRHRGFILIFAAALAAVTLGACGRYDPYVNKITPPSVPACSQIDFSGLFVNVTHAYAVDSNGVKTPLLNLQADPILGVNLFRLKASLPSLPIGTYNISIDENGGTVYLLYDVNAGSATSTTTFNVTTVLAPPRLALSATNSPAPGDAATLTPQVVGATSAVITPGNLNAASSTPLTVHPCKTTTYTLKGSDQCAVGIPAQATVTVAPPLVLQVSPTSVPAGSNFVVSGTGFNAAACGATQIELVSGATKYTQVTLAGDETSLSSIVNSCVPPGRYNVVVHTAVGDSNSSVSLVVTSPTGTACPSDNNDCTQDVCSAGACTHKPLNGTMCTAGGQSGTCMSGICKASTAPTQTPPLCVPVTPNPTEANLNECVPSNLTGPHCCNTAAAPALCNYTICRACIPHGGACGVPGAAVICCGPDDACVADPVTAATTCNVPDSPPPGGN